MYEAAKERGHTTTTTTTTTEGEERKAERDGRTESGGAPVRGESEGRGKAGPEEAGEGKERAAAGAARGLISREGRLSAEQRGPE